MACHLGGADSLRDGLRQRFQSLSPDDVVVSGTSCLGQCDGAPALSINNRIYRGISAPQAEELVFAALGGSELPEPPRPSNGRTLLSDPYGDSGRYAVVRNLAETGDAGAVIAALKASGLSGAGFPTGLKWEAVRRQQSAEKYVICNADESEPGTIKDRFILEHLTQLVIEGMIVAGLVTGAQRGILYIRHEYEPQEHFVRDEIARCYAAGILGGSVCGGNSRFNIEVFVSPGGYICGEESAVMEAIEGKRAEPRNKPAFPVAQGLWNKPIALNNVETFANVPQILLRGVDWYKSQGRNGAAGLKFVGVSGDVRSPGVFEIPMGTPTSEVIFEMAGGPPPGKQLNCAEGRCMLDMALNAVRFFKNESCGKCVPCRTGTEKNG